MQWNSARGTCDRLMWIMFAACLGTPLVMILYFRRKRWL